MFVIGIAGGSGSGKSTLVERLLACGGAVGHLPHDAYYLNRAEMPEDHRDSPNWDHPETLDSDLFIQHIDALKHGRAIERPTYDFANHCRCAETVCVQPTPVLLVEGILLFHVKPIRKRIDLKVYIDTPADLRILRRVQRDMTERDRTLESVVQQYHTSVRPMHDQFVEPSKRFADVVVPWELHNAQAVSLLAARVREHMLDDEIESKAV